MYPMYNSKSESSLKIELISEKIPRNLKLLKKVLVCKKNLLAEIKCFNKAWALFGSESSINVFNV
jgi:hypothetical protein